MKQVIVLVGPKGAGKSTIGRFVATEFAVHFVDAERVFLSVREDRGAGDASLEARGFGALRRHLRAALARHPVLCFETTGTSEHVAPLFAFLERVARLSLVRVTVAPAEGERRLNARPAVGHVPCAAATARAINAAAAQLDFPWAAELDNSGVWDPESIRATMRRLLGHPLPRG